MKDNVSFDPCQQEVIEARGGWHLVLAPPGCGKTQILTERIRRAHSEGVAYADMLCLTFTNRAARGMSERLASITLVGNWSAVTASKVFRRASTSSEALSAFFSGQ